MVRGLCRVSAYHQEVMSPKKRKSELQRQLEESVRLAKAKKLPVQLDALGRRLLDQDEPPGPTALDDPDTLPEEYRDADPWAEDD